MLNAAMEATRTRIDMSLHGLGVEIDRLEKEAVRFGSVDSWLLQLYATRIDQLIKRSQSNQSMHSGSR